MKFVKKVIRRVFRRREGRILCQWYKVRARICSWLYGAGGFIDSTCRFCVPVRIDGAGSVSIAAKVQLGTRFAPLIGNGCILIHARSPESQISIGVGTLTSNNISMVCRKSISIGVGCLIGDQVSIYDTDFHEIDPKKRNGTPAPSFPVVIGDNVWLGSRVMVLKGVTIGDNTVIGAMSLVTKSIPANCIAAGVPAKVVRMFEG